MCQLLSNTSMEQNVSSEAESDSHFWLQSSIGCFLLDAGLSNVILVLLWIFGTFAYLTVLENFLQRWILQRKDPKKRDKVAQNTHPKAVMQQGKQAKVSFNTRADKTADLIQMLEEWLSSEEIGEVDIVSIEVYIQKLNDACKDMNKANLLISSVDEKQCSLQESSNSELQKETDPILQLRERLDHVQSYTELRLKLMEILLNLLKQFQTKHDKLKTWAAETLSFLERIHSTACDNEKAIMKNLEHETKLTEELKLKQLELLACRKVTDYCKEVLKEIGFWSDKFKRTIKRTSSSNGKKPWYNHIMDTLDKQFEELNQHISTVTRLSMCYKMHLTDLLQHEYSGSTLSVAQKSAVSLPVRIQTAFDEMSQKASLHFRLDRPHNRAATDPPVHTESVP
ncbi:uncharacterized protein LOC122809378 [Protopterus annectens]|uniref:uncharacterized protein LOC122809378 n=1 Tax=Protopterus annectens TaxID=7888 RepID=UPI001CF9A4E8|nr:uncharacterized protein LOC122809378 [Protopterus annectens]